MRCCQAIFALRLQLPVLSYAVELKGPTSTSWFGVVPLVTCRAIHL